MKNYSQVLLIKSLIFIVAMTLMVIPEPSGASKFIAGFLIGTIAN